MDFELDPTPVPSITGIGRAYQPLAFSRQFGLSGTSPAQ
jgi:hypothetical protein